VDNKQCYDSLWLEAVEDELTIMLLETAKIGLDMGRDYLFRPIGSLEDPLVVLGRIDIVFFHPEGYTRVPRHQTPRGRMQSGNVFVYRRKKLGS